MYSGLLSDLDELAQTTRDPQAREYIVEAVTAYRAGAFRSAIIAAWIALAYDLIAKIRELSSAGLPAAQQYVRELDRAIEQGNIGKLQLIERELLPTVRERFELLASHEVDELARLQADRHLCSHPAFVAAERLFQPSPDAVRAHIVHAIRYSLSQKPVQGKHALSRVREDLRRLSFPTDAEEAFAYLDAQYLSRAKDSFLRGLTDVLMKTLLRRDDAELFGREEVLTNAFIAVGRRHPVLFQDVVRSKLNGIVGDLDDAHLPNLCRMMGAEVRIWSWLEEPMRSRVRQFLVNHDFSSSLGRDVIWAASIPELGTVLLDRFRQLESEKQVEVIRDVPHPIFVKDGIRIYGESLSFRGAEYRGESVVLPLACYYSTADVVALLEAAKSNNQIWYAGGTARILQQVLDATSHLIASTAGAWREFVEAMCERNPTSDHYSYLDLQRNLVALGAMPPRVIPDTPDPDDNAPF